MYVLNSSATPIKGPFLPISVFDGSSASTEPLMMKKKRGRPRILDAPGEVNPFAQTRLPDPGSLLAGSISGGSKAATTMPSSSLDLVTSTKNTPEINDDNSNEPTPGGPLTNDRIKELGIIKMNDYLSTGTRQQFWEEYYVKVVMQVCTTQNCPCFCC